MMTKATYFFVLFLLVGMMSCNEEKNTDKTKTDKTTSFSWDNANIYFLMTDRFKNGDPSNDFIHPENSPPAAYRGFMGGDLKGVINKIEEGYFDSLGINALWMTPFVEQIQGSVDEGTGTSYAFHGYWTRDWTALDPRFGSEEDFAQLVQIAHDHNIRVLIDAVANHTGPVTPLDSQWPDEWVRTKPRCTYQDYQTTVECTLVENLPDIKTDSEEEVELPPFLIEKWKEEGRYEQEVAELDAWFEETGYSRTPVNYILKWLVDFIKDYGIDGYRVDTAKHTESSIWKDLWEAATKAFEDWKRENPEAKLDDTPFYMVGEVYNYSIHAGRDFDYGDRKIDFFADGFTALINFSFKYDAQYDYDSLFSAYNELLQGPLKGKSIVNYISSHDDGQPFDQDRMNPITAGTKLMLCPGGVQVYYGDESARDLNVAADGDAKLRSFMNWEQIDTNAVINGNEVNDIITHWRKLGTFRKEHPAVGAGVHQKLSDQPYIFSRTWEENGQSDEVIVVLNAMPGKKSIQVAGVFENGEVVHDYYSGEDYTVNDGYVEADHAYGIMLLGKQ